MSLLLLSYFNKIWETEVAITERLDRNLQSGVNLILSDTSGNFSGISDSLDLFDRGGDIIKSERQNWGVFNLARIESHVAGRVKEKCLMYGPIPKGDYDGAIYLADHQTSLSLIGDVNLTGDVYLPAIGVKAGFIHQRGFKNTQLVRGAIKVSKGQLPLLNRAVKDYLLGLLKYSYDDAGVFTSEFQIADSLNQSFANRYLVIKEHGKIIIDKKKYSGKIIIVSDSLIIVKKQALLENVILVAPSVKFEQGFSGAIQVVASDSITAGEDTKFGYPSAFVLLKPGNKNGFSNIQISQRSIFEGVILCLADSLSTEKSILRTESNSLVTGIVYVEGYIENYGNIHGTVLTDYFLYKIDGSVYLNNLVDVEINRNLLPSNFTGSPIFGNNDNMVITWLQ